jgi:Survival motor neuron (SMN) interacting protein 1 (SIP1)
MVASRKRKRKNVGGVDADDDDDDTTCGLRQILPVASLPIDFDGEPTDGMQYLFTVRYVLSIIYRECQRRDNIYRRDARRLPDIKHVDNPYTFCPPRPAQSAIQPLSEPTQNVEVPSTLPSKEWRSEFEHRFRNFRGVSLRGPLLISLVLAHLLSEHISARNSPSASRPIEEDDTG